MRRLFGAERRGATADLLVVGLGNPGSQYEGTRHNLGAEVATALVQRHGLQLRAEKGTRALVAKLERPGNLTVVAVPQTFMNESGAAVSALVRRFRVAHVGRVVVVHDELDLPSGRVKVKSGGGTAGNNGLESIHAHLHDGGYARVRIGIGKPPGRQSGTDFVLRRPGRQERRDLDVSVETAVDAVEAIIEGGVEQAMNRFNALP